MHKLTTKAIFALFIFITSVHFVFINSVHAETPAITWQPRQVTVVAGRGSNAISVPVTITSRINLTDAKIRIVPELREFITPLDFMPTVNAGEPLSFILKIRIPPETPLGVYEGTLRVVVGNRTIAKPLPITITVGEVISSSGGVLISRNGKAVLIIPPGAVSSETIFTIEEVPLGDITLPPASLGEAIGLVYDLGPDGEIFDEPLVLTLAYDLDDIPLGFPEESLVIAGQDQSGEWTILDNPIVDTENQLVSAEVNHFTRFVVVRPAQLDPPEEPRVEYVTFVEGNPGVPGDGVVISSVGGFDSLFELRPPFSFEDMTDGITVSAFVSVDVLEITRVQANLTSEGRVCGGATSPTSRSSILVDGVRRVSSYYSQELLINFIAIVKANPGCEDISVNELTIHSVVIFNFDASTGNLTIIRELDALAIGFGEDVFPTEDTPAPFTLAFPLDGLTPYTATITAVFDHSNLNGFNCADDTVTAYTDEVGQKITEDDVSVFSADPVTSCSGTRLFGFKNDTGTVFSVNNQYSTDVSNEGGVYLFYDGHTGYDYPVDNGTEVFATADGTIIRNDCSTLPCINDGEIIIKHSNNFSTHFLHLSSSAVGIAVGSIVKKGDLIGFSGDTNVPGSPHLHLTVKNASGQRLDPYGWKGRPERQDPHQVIGGDNVCLWDVCQ